MKYKTGKFSRLRPRYAIMVCKRDGFYQNALRTRKGGTDMTRRLYLEDSHLTRCNARVLACTQTESGYDITLDQTVFFPNAGGQPCDTGTLRFLGGAAAVTGCDEAVGALVHHADRALPEGTAVEAEIDWARRFDHMQQHTGEHLLSWCAFARFGAINVGFHLAHDYGTLDLDRPLDPAQLRELERAANELACRDLPVTAEIYESEEAIAGLPLRKHAEGLTAPIRIVTIEGADCCTCCAPHCRRTGEIGMLFLADASPWRGGMRITFLCGSRALSHARAMHDTVDHIARRFSTGRENAEAAVQKQSEELSAARRNERALSARVSACLARDLRAGAERAGKVLLVAAQVEGIGARELRPLAQQALGSEPTLVFLLAADAARVQYILLCSDGVPLDMGELCQAVNAALGGKGGGRGALAQGSAPAQSGLAETLVQLRTYLAQRLRAAR